uniref:Uncharacterized protein n=1 Tax=Sphingomonas sp. JE1 TaxID=1628059 RepID=A0A0D4ZZV3_9SPHN|nr:hypothetical protein [Sphingomonas sp. CDS-1]AJW29471.1 hypothetical protein pJE1_049 [Sphingomonas sp. JE1]
MQHSDPKARHPARHIALHILHLVLACSDLGRGHQKIAAPPASGLRGFVTPFENGVCLWQVEERTDIELFGRIGSDDSFTAKPPRHSSRQF